MQRIQPLRSSMSITQGLREEVWKQCAGPLIDIPQVGERVFYFPQGHMEQVEILTNKKCDQGIPLPTQILCRVLNIQLMAEPETDEIYASITLMPELLTDPKAPDPTPPQPHKQEMHSYWKTLTAFDTSSNEGFLVLQEHAAKCLPQLDMTQTTPTQDLVARDLHGFEWNFKHIFIDQPKTHLLTTGWSNFVSSKRLNAGDAFLLLRAPSDKDLWCGVKRMTRQQSPIHSSVISSPGFLWMASNALMSGSMFTVNYKPRVSPFIISLNKYLEAMNNNIFVGMPFGMRFEGENPLEILRFSGTVVGVGDFSPAWPASKWRSLQVQWDEPVTIPIPERVSPWEIEPFAPFASLNISDSTTMKRRRLRPVQVPPSGITSRSKMRVDGILPTSPLLRASSSFSYWPRSNKASASSSSAQASTSAYAPVSIRVNNGEDDQVESDEEKRGSCYMDI